MSTQFDVSPADSEPVAVISAADSARRLDRLAPLLHELLAWDLVRQTESGAFVIPDEVQKRLSHLTSLQAGSIAQVYVGRKCGRCGSIRVTRMVEGVRLCSTCSSELASPSTQAVPEETVGGRKGNHGRSRWHRKAG